MDCLLNDEIFDHDNDESFRFDSEVWYDESIRDMHCDNQFFNDQDFDTNDFSISIEEEKKIVDKIPTSTNIFQVSPDRFSRGVSPDIQSIEDQPRLPWRSLALLNRRKSTLDSHNIASLFNGCEDPLTLYENCVIGDQRSDMTALKISNERQLVTKFKTPDSLSLFQVTPNMLNWKEREDIEMKYPMSPSTSSPESVADCDTSSIGTTPGLERGVSPYLGYSNSLSYRPGEVKCRPYKDDCYSSRLINNTRLFQSPIPQTGVLALTEEEKRTLLTEGYQIPYRLPLTKQEERNLKKIRRKIKNKISAQESRRKKKEYMEALEKKVEIYAHENSDLRKNLEHQENTNKSLLMQLRHLQHMVGRASSNTTSTCVMVFLICFSLILVGIPETNLPMKLPQTVLVVGNIHKFGYGSLFLRQRVHMTAMRRYLPPDIDGFVNMSYDIRDDVRIIKKSKVQLPENKGNEPLDSLESPASGQRRSVLLGNVKEYDDECVQYGPRYLWWLLQSPNYNTDEASTSAGASTNENVEHLNLPTQSTTVNLSQSLRLGVGDQNAPYRSRGVAVMLFTL